MKICPEDEFTNGVPQGREYVKVVTRNVTDFQHSGIQVLNPFMD